MCHNRYYDVLTVAASLLIGIVFTVLAFLNLLVTDLTIPILAVSIAFAALAAVAHGNAHGLRCQNQAARLIIAALLLAAAAIFALVFAPTIQVITLIVTFLIFSLLSYTLFSLFCFLTCHGHRSAEGGC